MALQLRRRQQTEEPAVPQWRKWLVRDKSVPAAAPERTWPWSRWTDRAKNAPAPEPVEEPKAAWWQRTRRPQLTSAPAAKPAPAEPAGPSRAALAAGRWRRSRPIGSAINGVAWAAAIVLVLGMAAVWTDANQANGLVHALMRMGTWLATPFHDIFRSADADDRLYENWSLAAVAYLLIGRALALLVRW